MQVATAMVALGGDRGNTVPKEMLTPSEIQLLQAIHGEEAVFDVQPMDEEVERTNRQELERLRFAYGGAKVDGSNELWIDRLFPGVNARVATSFNEIETPNADFYMATERVAPKEVETGSAAKVDRVATTEPAPNETKKQRKAREAAEAEAKARNAPLDNPDEGDMSESARAPASNSFE